MECRHLWSRHHACLSLASYLDGKSVFEFFHAGFEILDFAVLLCTAGAS
jgi:hypothetical protein